jgi:hypothetical protein
MISVAATIILSERFRRLCSGKTRYITTSRRRDISRRLRDLRAILRSHGFGAERISEISIKFGVRRVAV